MMTETETGYIYTLSDPRNDEVRYVGATRQPEQRLESHINQPHSDDLKSWVSSLESVHETPDMNIINVAPVDQLSDKEEAALDELSDRFDLLNRQGHSGYYTSSGRRTADSSDTSIRVSSNLADELHDRKNRGDSYEDVIWELIEESEE
jgi:hypothetical protein